MSYSTDRVYSIVNDDDILIYIFVWCFCVGLIVRRISHGSELTSAYTGRYAQKLKVALYLEFGS